MIRLDCRDWTESELMGIRSSPDRSTDDLRWAATNRADGSSVGRVGSASSARRVHGRELRRGTKPQGRSIAAARRMPPIELRRSASRPRSSSGLATALDGAGSTAWASSANAAHVFVRANWTRRRLGERQTRQVAIRRWTGSTAPRGRRFGTDRAGATRPRGEQSDPARLDEIERMTRERLYPLRHHAARRAAEPGRGLLRRGQGADRAGARRARASTMSRAAGRGPTRPTARSSRRRRSSGARG